MVERLDTVLYKLRFALVGVLLIGILFLLSYLLSAVDTANAQANDKASADSAQAAYMSESPNVITVGMGTAGVELGQVTRSTIHTANTSVQAVTSTLAKSGSFAVSGAKAIAHDAYSGAAATVRGVGSGVAFVGHGIGSGFAFVGRGIGGGVVFLANIPRNILGSLARTNAVGALIRPADHEDHEEIPIIDPDSPELLAALKAMPATQAAPEAVSKAPAQGGAGPAWPIHGEITTHFGVAHWPYQATHTGIDISDGRAPGNTPIKPFRPGKVIAVERSNRGLGNHVIIDHGNNVTSVYAHLASISVETGQEIGMSTTLGFEGSTGASTGSHLHFEIRVNGRPADPRQFINGQP